MIVELDEPLFYEGSVHKEVKVDRFAIIDEEGEHHAGLSVVFFGEHKVVHSDPVVLPADLDSLQSLCEVVANGVAHSIREKQDAEEASAQIEAAEE